MIPELTTCLRVVSLFALAGFFRKALRGGWVHVRITIALFFPYFPTCWLDWNCSNIAWFPLMMGMLMVFFCGVLVNHSLYIEIFDLELSSLPPITDQISQALRKIRNRFGTAKVATGSCLESDWALEIRNYSLRRMGALFKLLVVYSDPYPHGPATAFPTTSQHPRAHWSWYFESALRIGHNRARGLVSLD